MKALTQVIGSGECSVLDIPAPASMAGTVVVQSRASVISSGTESMLLDFGRSNLVQKARSQPDRVKQVLDKVATDGLGPTLAAVRDKFSDTLMPGYCQAGVVVEAGDLDAPFSPGERVATNGSHAEVVRVPYSLAARIPDGVSFESAAFAPLAAIALQGVRLALPTIGETIVVFGLGLVGQLTVQIVRANGCTCIGIDTNPDRVALAEASGATGLVAGTQSPVEAVRELTGGVGADAILMTLASTSDEPIHQAADMSRKRGRVVLVGVTGLHLRRSDFYEKELSFQVSCSYGPGRYDPEYEDKGRDYPLPYVRWTEQRNFQAVLRLMAEGKLDTAPLVSHRFPIDSASDAYELLLGPEPSLGIVLGYPESDGTRDTGSTIRLRREDVPATGDVVAGVIGAGGFARRTLLPAIRTAGIDIRTIVSSTGLSAAVEADRVGATFATSDIGEIFNDSQINTVFVLTRHDSHADLVNRALRTGKHVFVEKPLGLTSAQVELVEQTLEESNELLLMVGFNRRFAPLTRDLRGLLNNRAGPASLIVTVNAGHIDRDHWTQDPEIGGGRIVGEACHFIDLVRHLIGSRINDLHVISARDTRNRPVDDLSHLSLSFEDGSTAVVHYLASGSSRFPKERVEAFFDGKTAVIDNWRRLRTWGCGRRNRLFPGRMDKGHSDELVAFEAAVRGGGPAPIPRAEIIEVSRWSIRAAELVRGVSVAN